MEARPNIRLNPISRIKLFGAFICIISSELINVILGVWLMQTVKLSIIVIIFIISSYVLFYFRYVIFYSFYRSVGALGRNYFNRVDIQMLNNKLLFFIWIVVYKQILIGIRVKNRQHQLNIWCVSDVISILIMLYKFINWQNKSIN